MGFELARRPLYPTTKLVTIEKVSSHSENYSRTNENSLKSNHNPIDRIPGETTDRLIHFDDSKHIVVWHKGKFYKVWVYCDGKYLQPADLEHTFNLILADTSER